MIPSRTRAASARLSRAAACAALLLAAASAARGQAPPLPPGPAPAPTFAPEHPDAGTPNAADANAGATPNVYLVDDALLTSIPLTAAQVQQVMRLRAVHAEEVAELQPQVTAALRAMARAHARHDEATRHVLFTMLQTNATLTRAWAVTALRALLTDEQRPQFEANVRALFGGGAPIEPSRQGQVPQAPPTMRPSTEPPPPAEDPSTDGHITATAAHEVDAVARVAARIAGASDRR